MFNKKSMQKNTCRNRRTKHRLCFEKFKRLIPFSSCHHGFIPNFTGLSSVHCLVHSSFFQRSLSLTYFSFSCSFGVQESLAFKTFSCFHDSRSSIRRELICRKLSRIIFNLVIIPFCRTDDVFKFWCGTISSISICWNYNCYTRGTIPNRMTLSVPSQFWKKNNEVIETTSQNYPMKCFSDFIQLSLPSYLASSLKRQPERSVRGENKDGNHFSYEYLPP